jgi:hypothetical protein
VRGLSALLSGSRRGACCPRDRDITRRPLYLSLTHSVCYRDIAALNLHRDYQTTCARSSATRRRNFCRRWARGGLLQVLTISAKPAGFRALQGPKCSKWLARQMPVGCRSKARPGKLLSGPEAFILLVQNLDRTCNLTNTFCTGREHVSKLYIAYIDYRSCTNDCMLGRPSTAVLGRGPGLTCAELMTILTLLPAPSPAYREVVLTPLQSAGADVCADSDSWECYMLLRRPDDQGARMCRRRRD